MSKLCKFRFPNIKFHRRLSIIGTIKYSSNHYSAQAKSETDEKEPSYLDIILEHIPITFSEKSHSDPTAAFKEWTQNRNISIKDGKMLNRLKEHIMNGGHPDFPRLRTNKNNEKCLQHMTTDYFSSIDTECFQWIQKQKKKYKNRTINPWLQWKLEQLNVSLEWTREPLQDRDFRWIGYHDDVLNNPGTAELVAESDPLFPLHTKDQPLLKFLNPFYEIWYNAMPPALKQIRLMNANQTAKQSYNDRDDIRATRVIKHWDTELNEFRYSCGPKDIDQQRIDDEILYNQNQQNNEEENDEKKDLKTLRTAHLSKAVYDKNSLNKSEFDNFLKTAPLKATDEVPIERMNYRRAAETEKELKESLDDAAPRPMYSEKVRGDYFVEGLKRELFKASHLSLKELTLIIRHLGLGYHKKQNWAAKQMNNRWKEPYSAIVERREARTKWNDWTGNEAIQINKFEPTRYDDVSGVFGELSTYYKTRHPGQPPWGVWDIPEPVFDAEYFQIKVDSYLKCWRASKEGKEFVEANLKRKFDKNNEKHVQRCNAMKCGIELLEKEKLSKLAVMGLHKEFRHKFRHEAKMESQCREKTLEIQRLQAECARIDEIINDVYTYNELE